MAIVAERDDANELALLGGFVFSVGGDALLGISAGSQRLLASLAVRNPDDDAPAGGGDTVARVLR